ncbi:MAG: hypothetical protein D6798_07005 [Deltaproteobacteria bacterium]|nr:MAG: hypothetical protein D6798_07005 [Deltaproteobacteria bacterium]
MPATLPGLLRTALKEHLRPTVAQLVRDVVADEHDGERFVDDATEVLLRRIGGMAPHLSAGMTVLTLGFEAWSAVRGGVPYTRQAAADRRARLEEWRRLPGPLASWAQFYDKMGTFAFWAVVEERELGTSGAGR